MRFQQIRSATVKIEYAGRKFLIDPWLSVRGAYPPVPFVGRDDVRNPLTDLPLPIEEILAVDAVIATHLHFDHFDEVAKRLIPRNRKIFVQDAVDERELRDCGFTNTERLEANGTRFGEIVLYKTGCAHGSGQATEEVFAQLGLRKTTDACGVVFSHPREKTVYLAGDTIYFDGVRQALAVHRPDVIVLNAARAECPKGHPILMGLEDLRTVCQAAPSAQIIVSHMEAVSHAQVTRAEVEAFLAKERIPNTWIPADGESRTYA